MRTISVTLGAYLHCRCATLLDEELRISLSGSLAWDCARHWDAAEDHSRALELTGVIVDQLLFLGLAKEAADLCARAERYCRTAEQHADRLLKLSRAQRLVFDWGALVESLQRRRTILVGANAPLQKYSEDEISLFEARWWRDCNGHVLEPTMKRAVDPRAPTLHRLQMAVLALIVADNQHRRAEAETIAQVVESLEVSSPQEDAERSKARLIFHTAFGCLDRALVAGTRLVKAERRAGNTATLWRALRWLSLPLRLSNDVQGAVAILLEAYKEAARLGLRGEMWNAAFYLEGVALDCEILPLALEWAPVLAELLTDATIHSLGNADLHYTYARIEFMRGDFGEARSHLERSRTLKKTTPVTAVSSRSWRLMCCCESARTRGGFLSRC